MKVSVIGLGKMGHSITLNLLKKGVIVVGYDLDDDTFDQFKTYNNFSRAQKVEECYIEQDFILLSLPTGKEVYQTIQSVPNERCQSIILDTTTEGLRESRSVVSLTEKKNLKYLTCRIDRNPIEAENGNLAIYVGGNKDLFVNAEKLLSLMGEYIYVGNHDQSTLLKLSGNMIGNANNLSLAEIAPALLRTGIDAEILLKALAMGGAYSSEMEYRLKGMLTNNIRSSFSLKNAQHVIQSALDSFKDFGIEELPTTKLRNTLMKAAITMNIGKNDSSEIVKLFLDLNKTSSSLN
jgi:3-hydroxyisobutyrate dehydrogenase-like beta-hydroxyacid dehydrogenase